MAAQCAHEGDDCEQEPTVGLVMLGVGLGVIAITAAVGEADDDDD